MRVTNTMLSNRMMLNINRNLKNVDALYSQIASGKKIQVPSDNPIIASRALKFRANVAENDQYQRNVAQGQAWMEVTEGAFNNILDLLKTMYERCNEGATGTLDYTDKQKVMADIAQLVDQLGAEMNADYAGRYVFSGYRTDQPPVLTADNNKTFEITQYFDTKDIEKTISYQKFAEDLTATPPKLLSDPPLTNKVNILKLAYNNVNANPPITVDGYTVVSMSVQDADAYLPPADGTIHYIKETGELVLTDADAAAFKNGTKVTYAKTGFEKGELNPVVYFNCVDITNATIETTMNYTSNSLFESSTMYGILTQCTTATTSSQEFWFDVNGTTMTLAAFDVGKYMQDYYAANYGGGSFDAFVSNMYSTSDYKVSAADQDVFTDVLQGALQLGFSNSPLTPPLQSANPVVEINASGEININFSFNTGGEATFNTVNCTNASNTVFGHGFLHMAFTADPSATQVVTGTKTYTIDNQYIEYEFGVNTRIEINSLAKDVYTDKMYADLASFCKFIQTADISDENVLREYYKSQGLTGDNLENAVSNQLTQEKSQLQSVVRDRYNNMLKQIIGYQSNVSKEHTTLGSRINRLDLIQQRLEQDEVSYKKLMGDNEDVNLMQAIMERANAEAAYQASLKAGASIIQMTLANFI